MSSKEETGNEEQKRKGFESNKEDVEGAVGEEKQEENKDEEIEIILLFIQDTTLDV